jgi:hypothetical protein
LNPFIDRCGRKPTPKNERDCPSRSKTAQIFTRNSDDSEKTIYNQQGIGYLGQEGQKQDDKQPERTGNGKFAYYFINECHI